MHLLLLSIALIITGGMRYFFSQKVGKTWNERWENALFALIFPPLFLIITAFSVFWMGHHGQMLGFHASRWGCHLAIAFLGWGSLVLGYQVYRSYQTLDKIKKYPTIQLENTSARLIKSDLLYSAQIGFWQSELVISQGLLDALDNDHLKAVLCHETAHSMYKDTFWFFGLGYLHTLTSWLPYSQKLWRELLLLREIRADQVALKTVDSLILAESLLEVAQLSANPFSRNPSIATFNQDDLENRLEQRIDAILNPSSPWPSFSCHSGLWLLGIFVPLLTIPFHH